MMAETKYKTSSAKTYELASSQRLELVGRPKKKIPLSKLLVIERQRQRFMRYNNGKDGLN